MTVNEIYGFLDAFKYAIGPCYEQLCFSQERCVAADGKETISFKLQVGVKGVGLWTCMYASTYMSDVSLVEAVRATKRDFEEAVKDRRCHDKLQ